MNIITNKFNINFNLNYNSSFNQSVKETTNRLLNQMIRMQSEKYKFEEIIVLGGELFIPLRELNTPTLSNGVILKQHL